jgi:hypothetical protein
MNYKSMFNKSILFLLVMLAVGLIAVTDPIDPLEDDMNYDNDSMLTRLDEQYEDDVAKNNAEDSMKKGEEEEEEFNNDNVGTEENSLNEESWENFLNETDADDESGYFYEDTEDKGHGREQDLVFEEKMMEPENDQPGNTWY